jgi:proteasome lid subunit RPN8/RPN11
MFLILDDVLDQVHNQILVHPPELGGALLGPPDQSIITKFILDDDAVNTTTLYTPSKELTHRIVEIESNENLELKGIIHSHPAGMNRPSGPDHAAVVNALKDNPHLTYFLLPIVNDVPCKAAEPKNILPLGHGKITWYVGRRMRKGVKLIETQASVIPVQRDVSALLAMIGEGEIVDGGIARIDDREVFVRRLELPGKTSIICMFGRDYPLSPPVVLSGCGDGNTVQLPLNWDMTCSSDDRFIAAMDEHFDLAGSGPVVQAWGTSKERPLSTDADRAARAGWKPVLTRSNVKAAGQKLQKEAVARTKGLLNSKAKKKRVTVFGAGSVGSYLAEQLVRSGIQSITLIDHDDVEAANLSRSCYTVEDLGTPKVAALTRRLLNVSPSLDVVTHISKIQNLGKESLDQIVRDSALVMGATDDPHAQRMINRFAYARGCPAVYCGLWAGAKAGEIIISVPDRVPCFTCTTAFRSVIDAASSSDEGPGMDYGTGRMHGEVALVTNIHQISAAAVSLGLSLLADPRSPLHALAEGAIEAGITYVVMGMDNSFSLSSFFQETPGQYAYQSVWAKCEPDSQCPVCGDKANRKDPMTMPLLAPSADEVLEKIAAAKRAGVSQRHSQVPKLKAKPKTPPRRKGIDIKNA